MAMLYLTENNHNNNSVLLFAGESTLVDCDLPVRKNNKRNALL